MAYKFQLGAARLSGSTTFEEALAIESTVSSSGDLSLGADVILSQNGNVYLAGDGGAAKIVSTGGNNVSIFGANLVTNGAAILPDSDGGTNLGSAAKQFSTSFQSGLASLDGGINVNDDFTVDTDGGVVAVGINAGGALSGVTTLAASGLASVASISMDDGSTLGPDSVAGLWTFSADGDTTQANGAYDFDLASHDGTNGLKLGGVLVDASAADLNFTNVAAAGTAEASKAVVLDASKDIASINDLSASTLSASSDVNVGNNLFVYNNTSQLWGGVDLNSVGITAAGPIAGASTISGSGLISGHALDIETYVSASTFWGNGSGLSNVSSDSVDVSDSSANSEFRLVGVAASGDGVTLTTMDTAADLITMNASTGKLTLAGPGIAIGSADITEAEFEFLDGATAGSAVASKVLVVDASSDIDSINDISAAGLTLSDLTDNRLPLIGASGLLQDNAVFNYNDTRNPAQGGYLSLHVSSSASGSSYLQDGMIAVYDTSDELVFRAKSSGVRSDVAMDIRSTLDVSGLSTVGAITADGAIEFQSTSNFQGHVDCDTTFNVDGLSTMAAITSDGALAVSNTISGSSTLKAGGNVTLAGLGNKTVALTTDLMIIGSGSSGLLKTTSLASYSTAIAGAGLLSTAGNISIVNSANGGINVAADAINLDFNDLSAAAVNVAADSIAFLDADGNVTQKESIADFVGFIAGTGLSAASGQLSVSSVSTPTAFGDTAATMVEGLNYASAALTAARVLTLPNSDDLDVGEFVKIKMAAGLSSTIYASVAIAVGSGDLIDGDASIRLESPYAAVNLYKVAENVWRIL